MNLSEKSTISYCNFLENLTSNSLKTLNQFVDQNIFFSDPFHQTKGIEKYTAILETMFITFDQIDFKTNKKFFNDSNSFASFSWTLKMRHKKSTKPIRIDGMTLVGVSQQGLITRHEDYWDPSSSIYRIIPFLNCAVDFVRRRIKHISN
mgnify:CR=1 FL=1